MRIAILIGFIIGVLGLPHSAWGILEPSPETWEYYDNLKKREAEEAERKRKSDANPRGLAKPPFRSTFQPSTAAPRPEDPDAIAVVIANAAYRKGIPGVDYARNDGEAARAMMRDVFGVRPGNIIMLEDAGQADMYSVFGNERSHQGKLWSWIRPGRSKVYVYYSGHGVPGVRDGRAYLLPVDADPATAEINGYPLELLYRNLGKLETRAVTVLLESCFSGNSETGPLIRSASPVYVKSAQPLTSSGLTVLAAARDDQIASWDHGARLGLFTHYLTRALYGEADGGRWGNGDGRVTLGEVEAFLDDEMTYAARRQHQRVQQSTLSGDRHHVIATVTSGPGRAGPASRRETTGALRSTGRHVGGVPYRLEDGGIDGARSFIARHRGAVEKTIADHYRLTGKVWDQPEVEAAGFHIERMEAIDGITVIGVSEAQIEIEVEYRWADSGYNSGSSVASMRLDIAARELKIVRMWR